MTASLSNEAKSKICSKDILFALAGKDGSNPFAAPIAAENHKRFIRRKVLGGNLCVHVTGWISGSW